MKIYEKPMAIIEKIDVEDVITTSGEFNTLNASSEAAKAVAAQAKTDAAIVFEW